MKNAQYKTIVASYWTRPIAKSLISAGIMILLGYACGQLNHDDALWMMAGLGLFVTGFYLFFAVLKSFFVTIHLMQNRASLRRQGLTHEAMSAMDNAELIQVDKMRFGLTDEYLCLPFGSIVPVRHIDWMYNYCAVSTFMFIPIAKTTSCQIRLIDGTRIMGFYEKVKDHQAFEELLLRLKLRNPELLFGYTADNEMIHRSRLVERAKFKVR